jgi:RNA polymerase sigma-70 factor (ECF subfamily)
LAQDGSSEDGTAEPGPPELAGASSSELVRMVQEGEERALHVLFERYRPILRRWAAGRLPRMARDLVDTEDMIQEALMGTMRNIHSFVPRHGGAFGAYLRQSLNNRIRDEVRKAKARPNRADLPEDHPDAGASPLEIVIGREAMRRYEAALELLSDTERELVLARIEMGLSFSEIASASQKATPDAARMAVARALLKMAKEMGRE